MKIFVFGSSLTSSYWNGAATYYRGIYKALHQLGYSIEFAEPDVYGRQQHRDNVQIDYARVHVYQTPRDLSLMLSLASRADLVIKHSGVGADDEFLERAVLDLRTEHTKVAFWDVDAPATLARLEEDPDDAFTSLIPEYDAIFTYGGGDPVVQLYLSYGARNCYPIYNALDPETHFPAAADPALDCDLLFVGNRLPDREERVEQFFLQAALLAPDLHFILGGEGWGNKALPANVRWIGHVTTADHNRVNCSAKMVLNINRLSMARTGFSPPTRVFEAAGAGSCLITDEWEGIEEFFQPEYEILVAASAEAVVHHLRAHDHGSARAIGGRMRSRALARHTYQQRAKLVREIFVSLWTEVSMKAAS